LVRSKHMKHLATILDCDGTLADTSSVYFEVAKKICREHQIPLSADEYAQYGALPAQVWLKEIVGMIDEEQVEHLRLSFRAEAVRLLPTMAKWREGAQNFSHKLRASNYKRGMVTTGRIQNVDAINGPTRIREYYPHIIHGLMMAKKLAVPPKDCVYVGDSGCDMVAAKAAGYRQAILIPDIHTHEGAHREATIIVETFEELWDVLQDL
jgi:beta-phosphoglucomutase-like phosphatase (HAD superfamily)